MANTYPADGNAGAGTANPTLGLLQVQLSLEQAWNQRMGIALTVAGDNNAAMLYARPSVNGGYNWYFTRNQQDDQGLLLDPAGNVAFAKDVSVAGGVSVGGALKIKNWEISVPDYVFGGDYCLAGLQEVACFVRRHGHLPEIPPAAEIEAEGLDAARMILLLLKKIEELTLYLLQHEERLGALEAKLERSAGPTA
ncbi:MAG: hypothetical protein P4L83_25305 [Nevskia sp.]|nr:hypothetical protein [Nevskia sp.]